MGVFEEFATLHSLNCKQCDVVWINVQLFPKPRGQPSNIDTGDGVMVKLLILSTMGFRSSVDTHYFPRAIGSSRALPLSSYKLDKI
jgi:hypothetical protein